MTTTTARPPKRYGVTTDYDYNETHKRERLGLWSGAFSSDYEGYALSRPSGGYTIWPDVWGSRVSIRVDCPSPRTDENYREVDAALNAALNAWWAARTDALVAAS